MERDLVSSLDAWDGRGLLSVLGPTGSGKTSLVLAEVRKRFSSDLEFPLLVSVDSVAVFRGFDIGSAKPLGEERRNFSWIGVDLAEPTKKFTAADFVGAIEPGVEAALAAGRPVIVVGGSHFYERALVEGMSPGRPSDERFQTDLAAIPSPQLFGRLLARDARWATVIHPNDRYRITRYLDLTERQGLSFAALKSTGEKPARPWSKVTSLLVGADADPESIRPSMRARIEAMIERGWINEVKNLLGVYPEHAPAFSTVGYRQVVAFLAGKLARESLVEAILTSHMQLAKKQRTWLRKFSRRT